MPGAVLDELDPLRIQRGLQRLRATRLNSGIFGADSHKFVLNPTLTEAEVLGFERQHRISLPADYRKFLIHLGNGGAGPYYGVFPLGQMDSNDGVAPWHEDDGILGLLSEQFLLTRDWNDLTGMPADDLLARDEAEYERQLHDFEKKYWRSSLMNGAIPICHEGCALRIWLIVTGGEAGRLWHDGRADYNGLKPLVTAEGAPATFSLWYNEWLQNVLRAVTS
jgi:SMI1 / KNR4 family (SUKH-1)